MSDKSSNSLNLQSSNTVNSKTRKSFFSSFKSPVIKKSETPALNEVLPQKDTSSITTSFKKKITKRSISFNSPFNSPAKFMKKEENLKDKLENLKTKEALLDQQIQELEKEGFIESEIQHFIDSLHKYNEIKDSAQIIMGRLAELHGITVKEIHLKYGAPIED